MNMLSELTEVGKERVQSSYALMKKALEEGDLNVVLKVLNALFASIHYHLHVKREAHYHSIFYAIFIVFGFRMDLEASTLYGRIDGVLELSDKAYVMEFKYMDIDEKVYQAVVLFLGRGEAKMMAE